jgi:transposase
MDQLTRGPSTDKALREQLPAAAVSVDPFHLVKLANDTLTTVRQRVTREQHGRRGRGIDPAWTNRRLLLRAGNTLSPRALARLKATLRADDLTDETRARRPAHQPALRPEPSQPRPLPQLPVGLSADGAMTLTARPGMLDAD